MWPRLSIVAGLVAGVVVAGLALGAIVLLGPAPTPPAAVATPIPAPPASASAEASAEASASASASAPAASASAAASGSVTAVGSENPAGSAAPSGSGAVSASPSAETQLHIGEPAPALKLPKAGGGTVDLAALDGSPVWLTFMGTYCPSCQDEFPVMNGFATRYADTGLVVVAVDVKEDEATASGFATELGTTFPIALDNDGSAAARWGANALPVHYWIDAEGIVRDAATGAIEPDRMARGLTTILPGVDVKP